MLARRSVETTNSPSSPVGTAANYGSTDCQFELGKGIGEHYSILTSSFTAHEVTGLHNEPSSDAEGVTKLFVDHARREKSYMTAWPYLITHCYRIRVLHFATPSPQRYTPPYRRND